MGKMCPLWWTKPFYELPVAVGEVQQQKAAEADPEGKLDIMDLIREFSRQ